MTTSMTAVHLSAAAQSVVEETGVRPQDDVEARQA